MPGLSPKYIPSLPAEPGLAYVYGSNGSDYHFSFGSPETKCFNSAAPDSSVYVILVDLEPRQWRTYLVGLVFILQQRKLG